MAHRRKTSQRKKSEKRLVKISAFLLAAAIVSPDAAPPAAAATLSCPISLLFGNYTTCNAANSATVNPNNTRSVTGCLTAGGAPYNRAQCNISQSFPQTNYQVSVTATKYIITNTTGAKMKVDNFKCRFQGTSGTVTGACNHTTSGFALLMDIGARLNVGNPQSSGTYSGNFTVNTSFP